MKVQYYFACIAVVKIIYLVKNVKCLIVKSKYNVLDSRNT